MAWQGIRKHWKKYLIGGAVIGLVGRWGAKRYRYAIIGCVVTHWKCVCLSVCVLLFRDTVITRNLCTEAKVGLP